MRSIPARAGEPVSHDRYSPNVTVYPRACGGTVPSPNTMIARAGLSPRVRGNLLVN